MFNYNKTFLVEVSKPWVDCHCQQWIAKRHKHIGLFVLFPNYNSDLLSFLIKKKNKRKKQMKKSTKENIGQRMLIYKELILILWVSKKGERKCGKTGL